VSPKEAEEVVMWSDKPHRAYDQVLRSIRDAGSALDRAIRRIESVQSNRFRRERLARRDAQVNEINAAKPGAIRARAAAVTTDRIAPYVVEINRTQGGGEAPPLDRHAAPAAYRRKRA
jgi:hypothetical protein